jgi:hypothetical protein
MLISPFQPLPDVDSHLRLRNRPPCSGRLDCDLVAFSLPEFRAGLLAATTVTAVAVAALYFWPQRARSSPAPVIGVLFLLGAGVAYALTARLLPWLVMSVIVLMLGGMFAERVSPSEWTRLISVLPGAAMLASTPALRPLVPSWCLVLLGLVTMVGAFLAADMDARHRHPPLAPVCLAVSVVAIYETVPDTELVLVLLPLALFLPLLAWPVPVARLGAAGTYGVVGLLLFTVVVGGRGRLSAVIGGAACLGLLALEPIARRLAGGHSVLDRLPPTPTSQVVVGLAQLVVVFVTTRFAGTRLTVEGAIFVGVATTVAILAALVIASRRSMTNEAVKG